MVILTIFCQTIHSQTHDLYALEIDLNEFIFHDDDLQDPCSNMNKLKDRVIYERKKLLRLVSFKGLEKFLVNGLDKSYIKLILKEEIKKLKSICEFSRKIENSEDRDYIYTISIKTIDKMEAYIGKL